MSDRRLIILAVLVVLTLAVYLQVLGFAFVATDDSIYVTENAQVQKGLTPGSIAWAFKSFEANNWHPLTWLSLMLDVELGGSARVFHLTNLLLHLVNTLLLFYCLDSMTSRSWCSGFVAALFAVHPLHVESVAWVAERKDVLSTLFLFAALLAYFRYVKKPERSRFALVAVLFTLGLMAKPMLVTLPLLLLLLDYWPLKRFGERPRGTIGRLVGEKVPLFLLSILSSVMTLAAQWSVVGGSESFPFGLRLANALISCVTYLRKMFWPEGLTLHYPYDRDLSLLLVLLSALLLAGITFIAIKLGRRAPYLLVGWLWYLIALVPVIGIVQVGVQPMADRYTYIPLIGPFIAIVWAVDGLPAMRGRKWLRAALGALLIVLLAWIAHGQTSNWRDSETLFTHALAVTAGNAIAHNGLADSLAARGDVDRAIEHYSESMRIKPGSNYARMKLARIHVGRGRLESATELYREAVSRAPDDVAMKMNLATLLAKRGEYEEAAALFGEALASAGGHQDDYANYGISLSRLGRMEDAEVAFSAALRIDPGSAIAHSGLANVLARTERIDEAIDHLRRAIAINAADAGARLNLATLLLRQNELQAAEAELGELLRLKPDLVNAHIRLGEVRFRQGRIAEAIASLEQVLRLDPSRDDIRQDVQRLRAIR